MDLARVEWEWIKIKDVTFYQEYLQSTDDFLENTMRVVIEKAEGCQGMRALLLI